MVFEIVIIKNKTPVDTFRNSSWEKKTINDNRLPIKPRPYLNWTIKYGKEDERTYVIQAAIIANQTRMIIDEVVSNNEIDGVELVKLFSMFVIVLSQSLQLFFI